MAVLERELPHSPDAERAVLGAMIMYPAALERGLELLEGSMFFNKAHAIIFNRMAQLVHDNVSVDVVTLSEALERHGELGKVGGREYIADLASSVISPAHFDEHASVVKEKALLRSLVEFCTEVIDRIYRAPGDVQTFIDRVEAEFFGLTQRRIKSDFVSLRKIIFDVYEEVQALQKQRKLVSGISTGYSELDRILTGFHPSDYIVLGGRTSSGKTAFALSLARNIAITPEDENRRGVAIFSLEMSAQQLALRLLAGAANVSAHRMRQGMLRKDELAELSLKLDRVASAPIFIDDTANLSIMELRTKARRLLRRADISLIIVDYLQLVAPARRYDTRQEEVASISRALKNLARELEVTVLALAQLARRAEETKDYRPRLSHLRESGAIEQDADVVLLLHRPELYDKEKPIKIGDDLVSPEGIAELIIAKQRNGPTGEVYFAFDKESITFEQYELYRRPEDYGISPHVREETPPSEMDDIARYGGV